jgi:hypothetical protein
MRRFASIFLAGVVLVAACGRDPHDRSDADDMAFYRAFHSESGLSAEHYATLDQAVQAAEAVVVAQVVDVRHTRTFRGEVTAYPLEMVGIDIRPIEVVASALPAEFADELTVEFVGGSSGTADLTTGTLRTGRLGGGEPSGR